MNGPVACTRQDENRQEPGIPIYLWRPPAWEGRERPPLMDPERPMLRIDPTLLSPKPQCPTIDLHLPTDALPHRHGHQLPPVGTTFEQFEEAVRAICAEASGQIDAPRLRARVERYCKGEDLPLEDSRSAVSFVYLQLLFDRIVVQVCDLLRRIRQAYAEGDPRAYQSARQDYLEYAASLDHRDPGYPALGNPVKWVDIVPYVPDTDACGPIEGVRLVVHWNPHSSSSGVHL